MIIDDIKNRVSECQKNSCDFERNILKTVLGEIQTLEMRQGKITDEEVEKILRKFKQGVQDTLRFMDGMEETPDLELHKEIEIYGTYGLQQKDMTEALDLIEKSDKIMKLLIEKTIPFNKVEKIMPMVFNSEVYRYILVPSLKFTVALSSDQLICDSTNKNLAEKSRDNLNWIDEITHVDRSSEALARQKIDQKTKPLGSLGMLEDIALSMSLIQEDLNPTVSSKANIVFAADHGITCEGISAFPPDVTSQMVYNFLNEGAAINSFCHAGNIHLSVVDMGVDYDFESETKLIDMKVRKGTRNFAIGNAMTEQEAITALNNGAQAFMMMHKKHNLHIVGLG